MRHDRIADLAQMLARAAALVDGPTPPTPVREAEAMTNPLDNTNPYGIRVVADRGPARPEARAAFAKAARKATAGIDSLTQPRRRSARAPVAPKRPV